MHHRSHTDPKRPHNSLSESLSYRSSSPKSELCGRLEESYSREIESDAEIDSVVEKRIPDVGRVAMFQKSTEWRMEIMEAVNQFKQYSDG